ncbi:unnamed protein product [Adineta steineri]|uniref:SLC41A/MgtE integral membrane domain-containing protein n=1 Tax=Adineta steineri TaxID=433720 RepID=A0A815JBB2_9BILA|nr:unnamed protein product [Adineta steineri]CAF1605076.1 unnamed protein product [Adineta steineri]
MEWVPQVYFNRRHTLVLCSSSVSTASITSLALGGTMMFFIVISHKCKINRDNIAIATPIATSLDDLTILGILVSMDFHIHMNTIYNLFELSNKIFLMILFYVKY